LIAWLALAGLLPLVAMSGFGLKSVTDRLREAIEKETRRSLRIAMNLVLRQVQKVSTDASRLGHAPDVQAVFEKYRALAERPGPRPQNGVNISKVMERYRGEISSGLVELCDIRGRVFARYSLGSRKLVDKLPTPNRSPVIMRGLGYEHYVNLLRGKDNVIIRAASPVINSRFELLGAVVLSLPMDHHLADSLRAALRVHVVFYIRDSKDFFRPAASSLVTSDGRRFDGFELDDDVFGRARSERSALTVARSMGRSYSVGVMPLLTSEPVQTVSPAAAEGLKETVVGRFLAGGGNGSQMVVGLVGVATDRQPLVQSRDDAIRATVILAALGLAVALGLAFSAARSLSKPLRKLHSGAMAVARGDLENTISVQSRDEIGDLAEAFNYMTASLRENQKRLAARISEIITLHTIGRAVSSVMGLDEVLRTVVREITRALGAEVAALFLIDEDDKIWLNASTGLEEEELEKWEQDGEAPIAAAALNSGDPVSVDNVDQSEARLAKLAREVGLTGSLMAVPLEQKDRQVGVILINRRPPASPFGEGELRLLSTFADQAGTAIENARLYEEVTAFNERLEQMVEERTAELREANAELATTIQDLQETQAQLVLSERLAGLGSLVAGIAHEVNTPAAAIQGAVANLNRNLENIVKGLTSLEEQELSPDEWKAFLQIVQEQMEPKDKEEAIPSSEARRRAKKLEAELRDKGFAEAGRFARRMVDLKAGDALRKVAEIGDPAITGKPLATALLQVVLLKRNTSSVETAIKTINRIVTALRAYSHLDQTRVDRVNIHDGIETTLIILNNRLKYDISVTRRYGSLPPVPVYVDELNQVWTNLIVNAADAVEQREETKEIVIETTTEGDEVVVHVIDNGAGIPQEVLPRIFKPFFTTKPKGEGTGLGLGIVQRIVAKHGGRIEADSRPGRTCFSVHLPIEGPPKLSEDEEKKRQDGQPERDRECRPREDSRKRRTGTTGEA
jgi:signal transduction histidine kinase